MGLSESHLQNDSSASRSVHEYNSGIIFFPHRNKHCVIVHCSMFYASCFSIETSFIYLPPLLQFFFSTRLTSLNKIAYFNLLECSYISQKMGHCLDSTRPSQTRTFQNKCFHYYFNKKPGSQNRWYIRGAVLYFEPQNHRYIFAETDISST